MTHDIRLRAVTDIDRFFYWQSSIHLRVMAIRQIAHEYGLIATPDCSGIDRITQVDRDSAQPSIVVSFFTDDAGDWARMAAPAHDSLMFPQSLLLESDEVVAAYFRQIRTEATEAEERHEHELAASWRQSRRKLYEQLKAEFEENPDAPGEGDSPTG